MYEYKCDHFGHSHQIRDGSGEKKTSWNQEQFNGTGCSSITPVEILGLTIAYASLCYALLCLALHWVCDLCSVSRSYCYCCVHVTLCIVVQVIYILNALFSYYSLWFFFFPTSMNIVFNFLCCCLFCLHFLRCRVSFDRIVVRLCFSLRSNWIKKMVPSTKMPNEPFKFSFTLRST